MTTVNVERLFKDRAARPGHNLLSQALITANDARGSKISSVSDLLRLLKLESANFHIIIRIL